MSADNGREIIETLESAVWGEAGPDGVFLSMIVPTRGRPDGINRLLDSIAANTSMLQQIEIIMVIDDDDEKSMHIKRDGLATRIVAVSPGRTMGQLVMAGYRQSRGRFLMLLNDDVHIETKGWDDVVRSVLAFQPDDIALIHVNDTIFEDSLCTFPLVSRTFCEFASGITDEGYRRYCIDDAIFNTFNLLGCLGHQRITYLPDVVFRHENFELNEYGRPVYTPIPEIHREDHRRLEETLPYRRDIAVRLAAHIEKIAQKHRDVSRLDDIRYLDDIEALRRPALSRRLVGGSAIADADARATLVVFSEDLRDPSTMACLRALKTHTLDAEIVVLDGARLGRAKVLNELIRICTTDYLVVVDQAVRVGSNWLQELLVRVTHDVAIVAGDIDQRGSVPQSTSALNDAASCDGFDHWADALLLLDLTKLGMLRIDESFPRFFYDLDLRLRASEQGFKVASHICGGFNDGRRSRFDKAENAAILKEEVARWTKKWTDTKRLDRLDPNLRHHVSRIVDRARFPSVVDQLVAEEVSWRDDRTYLAGLRARLLPLCRRHGFARTFWALLDAELRRRHASPDQKDEAVRRRLLLIGSLRHPSLLAALAYRLNVKALTQAKMAERYLMASLPARAQREVGKVLCTFGMRSVGSAFWDNALCLERSRRSVQHAQPER